MTATDSFGATDTIRVEIYVVDVDEAPAGTGTTTAENTVEYTENSTDTVLTLSAGDPEGATPITWSLVTADPEGADGVEAADFADQALFNISQSGVLTFKTSPSFEDDSAGADDSYRVVVQATDGDAGPPTPQDNLSERDTRSWFKVIVNVSDVEEEGSISVRPTAQGNTTLLQPQVLVGITAHSLADGDGGVTETTYQWYRTTSRSATGTEISGATNAAYTPVHLLGGDTDIGRYLRVVATYDDRNGEEKTATAVSLYPTIAAITDNTAPSFIDGATTTRGVRENTAVGVNIGFPVTATDPESGVGEKLTYWLGTGTDAAMFSIDAATGQLKTNAVLDHETAASRSVMVLVTDSSGDATDNQDTIDVTINVLDADESPTIEGEATIEHPEGETALDTNLTSPDINAGTEDARYTATDQDGGTITLSLGGADKDLFKLDDPNPAVANTKILAFKAKPDFENPMDSNRDNVYQVTVQATDDANMGMKAVTVKVTNEQENGEVEVAPSQPRIGVPVTAALTDSDGVSYGPMWQWERAIDCETPVWMPISGANSATYEPRSSDLDFCLQAVATYNDGFHQGTASTVPETLGLYLDIVDPARPNRFDKTAELALVAVQYPSNNIAPRFGSDATKRFVPENIAVGNPIGKPVTAFDPNGADDLVAGGYSLSGADQASFDINSGTGQLMTGLEFDHEEEEMYTVTVTAEDSFGATDSIRVDIYVVDVDEMPGLSKGGISISGSSGVNYMENGMDAVGASYTATGAGAADADWNLGGDDAGRFADPGSGASAMLRFNSSPDYEAPADADGDNVYEVTLEVSDGTYTASRAVSVTVTDVDELGTLEGDGSVTYAENGTDAVGTYEVTGGDGTSTVTWSLGGDDAGDFDITGGVLTFNADPDYENPMGGANNDSNTYMVSVMASAGGEMEMMEVTVTVTNEDEDGMVTLMPMRPSIDMEITATLTDPDMMVTDTTWQWSRSRTTGGTFMPITGATFAMYIPVAADDGYYLKATATYTDGEASGKMADETTASPVSLYAIDGPASRSYMENGTDVVATYAASGMLRRPGRWMATTPATSRSRAVCSGS